MYRPIPYEQRSAADRIPPENYPRIQLDRSFSFINGIFLGAFGTEGTPLQAAIQIVRGAGSVGLLDVGCGTANGLRLWKRAMVKRAPCQSEAVLAEGISRFDYSKESMFRETEQACSTGEVRYIRGEAFNQLRQRSPRSVDVVLGFNSLMHMTHADAVLEQIVRILRPGGSVFFSLDEEQNVSSHPIIDYICSLDDSGYQTAIQPVTYDYQLPNHSWRSVECHLGWINKPEG